MRDAVRCDCVFWRMRPRWFGNYFTPTLIYIVCSGIIFVVFINDKWRNCHWMHVFQLHLRHKQNIITLLICVKVLRRSSRWLTLPFSLNRFFFSLYIHHFSSSFLLLLLFMLCAFNQKQIYFFSATVIFNNILFPVPTSSTRMTR